MCSNYALALKKRILRNSVMDPDPGGQKRPTKREKLINSFFEVLDVLF
jgi:hypothetical protein